ncbi:MAG TPA: SDR family NAD(P)-dependent oxidoreductase [Nevskiaceae bacterium]|nr:SDR family NAD(P)-dependent oxidoreductase [Nevskiaceae bacterium]
MQGSNKLAGRGALVTGGSSGIGRAVALRFAAEGAHVVISDIDDAGGQAVIDQIRGAGGTAHYLHVDVTDRAAVRKMVHDAHAKLGGLAVLVNNAMTNPSSDYGEDQRWNLMLESGLSAYWAATSEAAPLLAASGKGAIVNISSIAGARVGIEFSSDAYSSAKAGVLGLTRRMAKRHGPSGVRVNAICPGIIETPRWRSPGEAEPQFARRWRLMTPLRRYGLPDEVAALVLFFACDESAFITGQDIAIDGGFTTAAWFESIDFDAP